MSVYWLLPLNVYICSMPKPKETKQMQIRVPADKLEEYSQMVYRKMYKDDKEDKKIYMALYTNPTLSIDEIIKMLKTMYPGFRRRKSAIKQIAINCGFPVID